MGAETKKPTEQTCDNGRDKNGTGGETKTGQKKNDLFFNLLFYREDGKQSLQLMIPGLRLRTF